MATHYLVAMDIRLSYVLLPGCCAAVANTAFHDSYQSAHLCCAFELCTPQHVCMAAESLPSQPDTIGSMGTGTFRAPVRPLVRGCTRAWTGFLATLPTRHDKANVSQLQVRLSVHAVPFCMYLHLPRTTLQHLRSCQALLPFVPALISGHATSHVIHTSQEIQNLAARYTKCDKDLVLQGMASVEWNPADG